MRILPNEFAMPAMEATYHRPETVNLGLPVLIAFAPVLIVWWAVLSVMAGATALIQKTGTRPSAAGNSR